MALYTNLFDFIDMKALDCMNANADTPASNAFMDNEVLVQSDADEQMILKVFFRQPVKLAAVKIWGAPGGGDDAPNRIKIFQNAPNIGFEAEDEEASCEINMAPGDAGKEHMTRFVKFQNVSCLQVFFAENHGGATTSLRYIEFIGQPAEKMDMKEFKPIKG